ncbi:MarR family transcriptional regulator [Clostridium sp. CCUG 7971]|nr:MarR family transcriptional regulator [Clostridium sp. CCUG 7971]
MARNNDYIGKYISQLYRKGNSFISRELCNVGIGSGQFMFLMELYRQDGRSQEELSEVLNIDKGTTARAIKKLEEEGFLLRIKDERDKRAYKLYLTDKGKDVKEDIQDVLMAWENMITSQLNEEEKDTMKLLLKKICKIK